MLPVIPAVAATRRSPFCGVRRAPPVLSWIKDGPGKDWKILFRPGVVAAELLRGPAPSHQMSSSPKISVRGQITDRNFDRARGVGLKLKEGRSRGKFPTQRVVGC